MGGLAFRQLGLHTPRMNQDDYLLSLKTISSQLYTLFKDVRIPKPAPEKRSHGDLDFLVDEPYRLITPEEVQQTIGASHLIESKCTWNFAVPVESELEHEEGTKVYRQVDVHLCNGNIDWEEFMDSYGDLWTILGSLIRMHGLLANNDGFYLLLSPIDKVEKQASKVLLTRSPEECLSFLGLDCSKYVEGFDSITEMFVYITTSRMFTTKAFDVNKLTHNDRAKSRQRSIYSQWLEMYIPSLDEESYVTASREDIAQEAIKTFGKEVEVQSKLQWWAELREERAWWSTVAINLPIVIADHDRNLLIRNLRKMFSTTNPPLQINTKDAHKFVENNWQKAYEQIDHKATERATVNKLRRQLL